MTRWDEQEKEKSKSISGIFFFITIVFSIGFVIGMLLGLNVVVPDTAIPPVFGESTIILTSDFIGPPDYKTSFEVLEQYRALMNGEILTSSLTTTHHITLYDGIGVTDSIVTSP